MSDITTEAELRETIGTPHRSIKMKKFNSLEQHSRRYLTMSHLLAITAQNIPSRIHLVPVQQSNLVIIDDTKFTLTVNNSVANVSPIQDEPCGLYILTAGFEESLRINGSLRVTAQNDNMSLIEVTISEHYFHCAKSIKRSQFWTSIDQPLLMDSALAITELSDNNISNFIEKAPFLLLATHNEKGDADLSPRGDPGGFLRVLDENTVLIPERPGNKIADSLTNIITNPSMAILLLIPGTKQCLILIGNGKLTTSKTLLEPSEIKNKIPKIGIILNVKKVYFGIDSALASMNLWNKADFEDRSVFPSLGMMISEQLQTTKKIPGSGSVVGRVLGAAIGASTELAIKQDYKKNLY